MSFTINAARRPATPVPHGPASRPVPTPRSPRRHGGLPPLTWEAYGRLNRRLEAAIASPRVADKLRFLHRDYNRQVAPRLRTEEAALQYLSNKLAYLHLPVGAPVALCIDRNLAQEHERSYPRWSRVASLLPADDDGPVGLFLQPSGLRSLKVTQRALFLARGTAVVGMDNVAASLGYPTGLRADFFPAGPGLRGFERQSAVMEGIGKTLADGRPMTLTGHSLGGAWATYAMAALPRQAQARCRLITYSAPGVARDKAEQITAPRRDVRLVRDKYDFIHKAGPCHPRGEVIVPPLFTVPGERRSPHCAAPLAVQELLGLDVTHERRQDWWHDMWTPLEGPRWLVGTLLGDRLPP